MKFINVRLAILGTILLTMFSASSLASDLRDTADDELRAPQVPCAQINVPDGNQVAFRAYASGVQVYWWNGTGWAFVVPLADLYADPGFHGKIGRHYGGPAWRSNSGSLVIGRRLASCSVDTGSLSFLLLEADETDGVGIFRDVTYIQRVNTIGGVAPSVAGTYVGAEISVPYTAEYYFYKRSGR